jgi:hypothetical protein
MRTFRVSRVVAVLLCAPTLLLAQARGLAPNAPADRPHAVTSDSAARRLHTAMQPYIEQARATYPAARQRFLAGLPAGHVFFVTTRLRDETGREEQVFIAVDSILGSHIFGRIASDISTVSGYRYGEPYELTEAALLDWLISKPDGSEEGNFVGKFLDAYRP